MVSPFPTLQSWNSLRKSIAILAWFNASCMAAPNGGLQWSKGLTSARNGSIAARARLSGSTAHRQAADIVGKADPSSQARVFELAFEPVGGADAAERRKGAAEHHRAVRQRAVRPTAP